MLDRTHQNARPWAFNNNSLGTGLDTGAAIPWSSEALLSDPDLAFDLQDSVGNSAIQSELSAASGPVCEEPVQACGVGATPAAAEAEAGAEQQPTLTSEISEEQLAAARAWAAGAGLGEEAIRQLQGKVGAPVTGVYDDNTIHAVYNQQRALRPRGALRHPGQARRELFQQLGLIWTNAIEAATVTDGDAATIAEQNPEGVTVAVVPSFEAGVSGRAEMESQATLFAGNQRAVGLSGGAVTLGVPVHILETGDIVEAVQSIHRGLLAIAARMDQSQGPTCQEPSQESPAEGPAVAPAWTQVKNLAIFCHGMSWGMGSNASNDFSRDGLHEGGGGRTSNIDSFVEGLRGAIRGDIRMQLFACSTGADDERSSYQEWTDHEQGRQRGADSFAANLAQSLGPDASVYAHSTVGHTTENYAARVFGAEAREAGGTGNGGLHVFDQMYPESFVQSELSRLYPDLDETARAGYHDPLREQMWSHFKDAISSEHHRSQRDKRFSVPMGQECFVNPPHAAELLHEDWTTNWIPTRLRTVRPTATR